MSIYKGSFSNYGEKTFSSAEGVYECECEYDVG